MVDANIVPSIASTGNYPADPGCGLTREVDSHRIRRLALVIEYDGTNYKGFQLQASGPTIQGEIETALAKFTQQAIRVRGASRTDSGAHARGQVVDFLTDSPHSMGIFPKALNYYLPGDIRVQSVREVSLDFNSRRSATSRIYRYNILISPWPSPLRRTTHHWLRQELIVATMNQAAQRLVGVHDFRTLAVGHPKDKSAVRNVHRWDVWQEADTVIIECEANGFLRHQIRKANSILVQVGLGVHPESIVSECLEADSANRVHAPILPPQGLCLMRVVYESMNQESLGESSEPVIRRPQRFSKVAATINKTMPGQLRDEAYPA